MQRLPSGLPESNITCILLDRVMVLYRPHFKVCVFDLITKSQATAGGMLDLNLKYALQLVCEFCWLGEVLETSFLEEVSHWMCAFEGCFLS